MPRKLSRSNAHFARSVQQLPLGVASNFRYWGDDRTLYIKQGKGGRITDIDDNTYVDYRLGYGPAILGYAHPEVDAAAREGMEVGGVFAFATEREYTVAKRISEMVPAAELVRYSNSGTEAVMAALRVARTASGKDDFIMIEGGYHGVFDSVLWYSEVEDGWTPDCGRDPEVVAYSAGVPETVRQHLHMVPMNDAEKLEDVLRRHGDRIGTLLIEPMMGNCCSITATREYLHAVRELCNRYDVILVIDEVKTGFRVARGGIQELMGIEADICTFAKAMANGYPIAVVAGREPLMRHIGDGVVHGGTYTAHSVSIAAAEKTLEILATTSALEDIADYGNRLQAGIGRILDARQIAHSFVGHPSMGGLFLADRAPTNYREWVHSDYSFYDAMAPELHDRGVIVEPDSREPWFICAAHDQACLDDTLVAFEGAVDATIEKLAAERGGEGSAA
ncbi:MAG: aminotransferase class III-fold pyridoxal phosphate-dependent enzyme [Halieaceae bacterium]|jgi:glutamate-1-semialdehyde 2,1-aminomutase|nr:aminotransferase class III-fold pyridoxal phosphate-dependent enzyme [Halieaceae bacterium]